MLCNHYNKGAVDLLKTGAEELGIFLTPEQLLSFERYCQELLEWNRRFNLTSITEREEVMVRHFLDSITVVLALRSLVGSVEENLKSEPWEGIEVLDLGSGAGFPGLPLKIAFPALSVTLVESVGKKARFLAHVVEALSLQGVNVVGGRGEDLARTPRSRESFHLVVERGVGKLAALAEVMLPFCIHRGLMVAMKQGDIEEEVGAAQPAIRLLGGRLKEVLSVKSSLLGEGRCLVLVEKVVPTPPSYPRRAGIPFKRPL